MEGLTVIKRTFIIASLMLSFISGVGYTQQLPDCSTVPSGTPCRNGSNAPVSLTGPQLTPSQTEIYQKLTTEQRKAVEEAIQQKEGTLTPDAIDALKTRPEFQGLTSQDILQGKEMLEKKEAQKKELEKKERESKEVEKKFRDAASERKTLDEKGDKTVFERVRNIGKYQEISTVLKPFGYDFFQESVVKVVTDRKDIPVPGDYTIGPGDEVKILLWGRVNANYSLVVDRNGNITIPQVGPIPVAGLTFEQMSKHLIKQSEQFVGANIDVTMGALKSMQIFVLGDVKRPGAYTIGSFATITDALLIAGGPAGIGTMRNIQLRRKDKIITTFDLYDLLLKGDKSKDTILQVGDVVFVPVAGPIVGIAGNVKRPAIYELKEKYDLNTLFELAGGIIPTAYTQQIQVERIVRNEKQIVVDIDDKQLMKAKDFHLQDVDLVKIFNIAEKETNVVFVNGNVKRPGKYEYKPGMRIRDLLKNQNDLLEETFLDYALLMRLEPPNFEKRHIPFSLATILSSGERTDNFELQPRDTIYVFSKWFFRDKPFVIVEGEVRDAQGQRSQNTERKDETLHVERARDDLLMQQGIRENDTASRDGQLRDGFDQTQRVRSTEDSSRTVRVKVSLGRNMRVRDAILIAGDLTKNAYLEKGEIYRTGKKRETITIYFHVGRALQGDPENNIVLQDEDRIVVHSVLEYEYKKTVSVGGDVLKPGDYQYVPGATVKDLVFTAGNILESAYLDEAEITSQVVEGDKTVRLEHRNINLKKALQGEPADNVVLKPYDRLTVKRLQDWRKEKFVAMSGEVRYPGRYIIKKNERLSSLIERAGGYSDDAYLRGAFFTRARVKDLQQKTLEEMVLRMERELLAEAATIKESSVEGVQARQVELQQRQKFVETLKKLPPTGRMTVYLAHLRLLKGSVYDIELEEGDSLFIPTKNSVVNVAGAVMSNGSFVYIDGIGYEEYIRMAGGYSRYADTSNIFVMKVDGGARKLPGSVNWNPFQKRWEIGGFGEARSVIEAGDSIVVPEKLERTAWLRDIKDITQIFANAGLAAASIALLYETLK
jgi:polysaccharide biosynthesis/export protein